MEHAAIWNSAEVEHKEEEEGWENGEKSKQASKEKYLAICSTGLKKLFSSVIRDKTTGILGD